MAEQALYRKYRSQTFDDVIGQDHIMQTLGSALKSGRISHAYLFTGPRGVGKTSVARLLARALNCTDTAATSVPCNTCPSCVAAINSTLDIIEIDAASNNSVDDVRELRDKVAIAPSASKYKVYIIDEVHMLSSGAFNALLKTLEEPPSHAVFILATTESHKIPATILSRTQNFSFRPITGGDLVSRLERIAAAEDIAVDPAALELVAARANGGFRDAISLLDQVAASGERPATVETVRRLVGGTGDAELMGLALAIANRDAQGALSKLDAILSAGAQAAVVTNDLITIWREAMRAGLLPDGARPAAADLAAVAEPVRASLVIDRLLGCLRTAWPQASLEAALVALCIDPPVQIQASVTSVTAPAQPTKPGKAAERKQSHASSQDAPDESGNDGAGSLASSRWPKVLVDLKQQNQALSALLQGYPADFSETTVTVRVSFGFHHSLLTKPQNRQMIEAVASKVYGQTVSVLAIIDESAVAKTPRRVAASAEADADLTAAALEILGGEVID